MSDTEREEVSAEQEYVSGLYAHLDGLRVEAARRVEKAEDAETGAVWRAEAARLAAVEDGLCFGRLDLDDGRRVYIGRTGLFRDDDEEALLVDWRAPVARAFYTATAGAPDGVRRRRRIATRGRVVVGLDDELLDAEAAGQAGLTGEAALLAAVSVARTGRMRDIVTTLRTEQDRIIRDEHGGALVVQGGPGTGKTVVALHRVAYLLYTREHLRARGVLVIGPNQVFLDYIGQVLPGLGENSVVTATIPDLYPDVGITRVDPPDVAAGKGDAYLAERVAAEVRARVVLPETPVDIDFEGQALTLEPVDWRHAATKARAASMPHNHARMVFQHEVVATLTGRLADLMEAVVLSDTGEALDGGSADGRLGAADIKALAAAGVVFDPEVDGGPRTLLDEVDRVALRDSLLADAEVQAEMDAVWPELSPEGVVADLIGRSDGWSAADIPLLDEAAVLVGSGQRATYGHVVVDEAQELSEMAWRMLMRRDPSRSMTIVGDLAQTGTPAGASSWARVLGPHLADRWRLAQLTVNYRTPAEIMDATADLLAAHHPDLRPPGSVRSTGVPPWRQRAADPVQVVAELVAAHTDGHLAIIAPAGRVEELASALSLSLSPDPIDPVVVLPPDQAKGLEFDAVVVVDPEVILAGVLGHNDLYVAMTRATQRLGIVHTGPIPDVLARLRERNPVEPGF
ncbi:HelD family protein [Actinokineospora enzanensis]|uniref:HelD family protein n=1 Tax=Actinokineospora enzanensis TaxID=155975 RepID=UPI0005268329|nr:ATP-binding domain-containing protein [Actinokineospora enzanensis]